MTKTEVKTTAAYRVSLHDGNGGFGNALVCVSTRKLTNGVLKGRTFTKVFNTEADAREFFETFK